MRLTKKLRTEYIQKTLDEIKEKTGLLVSDKLFEYPSWSDQRNKVIAEIPLDYTIIRSDKDYKGSVIFIGPYRYFDNEDTKRNFLGFWSNNSLVGYSYVINKNGFDKLVDILEEKVKLDAREEWNKFVGLKLDLKTKRKEIQMKKNKMTLDFSGSITLKNIKDQFGSYLCRVHKTKLSFHKTWTVGWKRHWLKKPDFELFLKPYVYNNNDSECLYNRTEFENELKRLENER